jgi:hypothetical protein
MVRLRRGLGAVRRISKVEAKIGVPEEAVWEVP